MYESISPEEQDLIDRYLANELTKEEGEAFEKRLSEDARWHTLVAETKVLALGIEEAALQEKLTTFHDTIATKKASVIKMSWPARVAIAASLVLAFSTIIWLTQQPAKNTKIVAAYFKPDPGLPTTMGVSDHYEFERAMVEYKTGNYTKAIESWERIRQHNPANDTLNYFIASALLANKEATKSIPFFDAVIKISNSAFLQEAYWYRGLAFLQQGNKEEAINSIKQSNHPRSEELLQKIENK